MSAEHPLAEAATNTECLFFTKFPIEIRRNIYRLVFSGSRLEFASFKSTGDYCCKDFQKGSSASFALFPLQTCQLLLACHQTYNEGRTIFYEEVVIYTDASQCEGVKLVCENLSEFAKLHIQHFRSFVLGDGGNAILPLFDDLPKLKTCQIYLKGCMFDLKPAKFDECNVDTFVERFQELFSGTSISSQNLFDTWGLSDVSRRVTFLLHIPVVTQYRYDIPEAYKVFFVNINTGKCFLTTDQHFDHEEGFRRVLT